MAFTYVVYYFTIEPNIPWSEILIAQLQSLPFESFEITGFNIKTPLFEWAKSRPPKRLLFHKVLGSGPSSLVTIP